MTQRRYLAHVAAVLALVAPLLPAGAAQAAPAVHVPRCWWGPLLANGDFETPAVAAPNTWILTPGGGPVVWKTDDPRNSVELWGPHMGVPPFDGNQFSEINATGVDMIYQDVPTLPGTRIGWRLAHRARDTTPGFDVDRMQVVIGAPGATLTPVRPYGQSGPVITSGENAWHVRAGGYLVPPGQTTTRIGFQALSGPPGYGNLLDGVAVFGRMCRVRQA